MTIATGDTKVVDRGKGDGIYINTTGVGMVPAGVEVSPERARPGDVILLSGSIAVHGIAIMSVREGLEFETELRSRIGGNRVVDMLSGEQLPRIC